MDTNFESKKYYTRRVQMKKFKFISMLLVCIMCVFSLIGCTDDTQDPKASTQPTLQPTAVATATPVPTATTVPTATPGLPDDLKLGVPNEKSEVIYSQDFEEDYTLDDVYLRYRNRSEVVDGKIVFDPKLCDIYTPHLELFDSNEILQYEISLKISTQYPDSRTDRTWMCPFVGIRVYDVGENYGPAIEDSGFWIGVTGSRDATIHHGVTSQWPQGAYKFTLPEAFTEEHTLTIIDVQGVVYYYMNTADSDLYLICKVDLTGDLLTVVDAAGTLVYTAENNLKGQSGYFSIVNHLTPTSVDDITIKLLMTSSFSG